MWTAGATAGAPATSWTRRPPWRPSTPSSTPTTRRSPRRIDPRHYGRYGFWCGERWGISLENGQYLPGLQAVELAPGSLANAAGRFREGFAYAPDAAALDAFDALFLVKEKAITDFQQEFQVMCSLGHEVIPNGFMQ